MSRGDGVTGTTDTTNETYRNAITRPADGVKLADPCPGSPPTSETW